MFAGASNGVGVVVRLLGHICAEAQNKHGIREGGNWRRIESTLGVKACVVLCGVKVAGEGLAAGKAKAEGDLTPGRAEALRARKASTTAAPSFPSKSGVGLGRRELACSLLHAMLYTVTHILFRIHPPPPSLCAVRLFKRLVEFRRRPSTARSAAHAALRPVRGTA